MLNVLVTGAAGFIGRHLCQKLESLGHTVIKMDSRDGDIAQPKTFQKFNSYSVDHVFHLASKNYVPDSWKHPYEFYSTNILGTQNVNEFCRNKKSTSTFISAYIYGIPKLNPIAETVPAQPNNPYAHSKFLAEQICEFYSREYNLKATTLRLFNVYGPGQRKDFLIPTLIDQALNSDQIKVQDLTPCRDYVYIDDVINSLILTLSPNYNYSVFNIGSGISLSVAQIINIIQQQLGSNKEVISLKNERVNEIPDVIADISKARLELGWVPKLSFQKGIQKTISNQI